VGFFPLLLPDGGGVGVLQCGVVDERLPVALALPVASQSSRHCAVSTSKAQRAVT